MGKNHYYALYCKKHESPSPKDALCQVWLKLAQWIFKFFNAFSLFCYLPLEKDMALHLIKLEPLQIWMFCFSRLVEIRPVILEKIFKF